MSFSYSGNPSESDVDAVRFLVGDTEVEEHFLEDEEIVWLNSMWVPSNSIYWSASMAAESIAARFAREVTVNSDSQTVSTSELQQKYLQLAEKLRDQHRALLAGGYVDAGGMIEGETAPPDVAPLAFGRGMHDMPDAGIQDMGNVRAIMRREWGYE